MVLDFVLDSYLNIFCACMGYKSLILSLINSCEVTIAYTLFVLIFYKNVPGMKFQPVSFNMVEFQIVCG